MTTTILRAAVAAAVAALALSACHREAGEQTVGQRLDSALDRTQQKLSEAGQKAKQELSEAGQKAKQELNEAGQKTGEKLNEAGAKIATATDNTVATAKEAATPKPSGDGAAAEGGKPLSDTAITASIKADFLKDPDLSVLKIDVDTKNGVVTLNGLAADEPARGRAEKIAGAVKGVKEVRNFLVVKRA
jgi:hyperosmotically inducible periplasmic protein